jgi:hypothetical protein
MVYYDYMHFAVAHSVVQPKKFSVKAASIYLASLFVVAVLTQLFWFEDFPGVIESYQLSVVDGYEPVIASMIVILEMFALPYLLWMKVSRLMRVVSLVSGLLALTYWLIIGFWQMTQGAVTMANTGILGPKIVVPTGTWFLLFIIVLFVVMGYIVVSQLLAKPRH